MKDDRDYTIPHPRRRLQRALVRGLGRLVLPLAFRITFDGREHFPSGGPLLVAGNHSAAMEVVLAVVYTPWPVELLGAADIPHETITQVMARLYGMIPVHRGRFDRTALMQALSVLEQGGVVGIFPEGGIWEAGRMAAHTGVAWLSYRAGAPVLPIGFGGTTGALGAALQLERPRLTMRVGQVIPAARLPADRPRKDYLEEYAGGVVSAIRQLLPPDDPARRPRAIDERFALRVAVQTRDGRLADVPDALTIAHAEALAELLHRPAILKIFTSNLNLPTRPLQTLAQAPDAVALAEAARAVLRYLDQENPYLLTYRFGPRRGEAMRRGMEDLLALARWAADADLQLTLTPVRRYVSPTRGEEVVQTEQNSFEDWM
jgi:1-acyl-sn-glycerol-3-phosphate acyltransferase